MKGPLDRRWTVVTVLSIALLFFSIPHILEDFSLGEPAKRGVPPAAIAFVVSLLLAAQGLGLYALGRGSVAGLRIHAGLGLLWAVAAGMAQVPELLQPAPYRSGLLSAAYVVGIIGIGLTVSIMSLLALVAKRS